MQYGEFISEVRGRTSAEDREEAEQFANATLQTLGERIGQDESDQLASELPTEFTDDLLRGAPVRFGVDEFVERVDDATDVEVREADVRGVFAVLDDAVSAGELDDVRARLPDEYERLL